MSKAIRFCSLLLVLATLFGCIIIKVSASTTYHVNGTNVTLRAEASSKSTSLAKLTNVTVIYLQETANTGEAYPWYKVKYENTVGWIYGEWLTKNASATPNQNAEQTFQASLSQFPESYHSYLRELHSVYPNWKFTADVLNISFEDAVNEQYKNNRKHVELSQSVAWRSMYKGAYDWNAKDWKIYDSDRWVSASKEVIAYYMDPRNFLNNINIYMFLKQSYDSSTQTESGLIPIIQNTFLAETYSFDANHSVDSLYGGSYSKVIMAAAEKSGVSPYIIASKILTEQGDGKSWLISGIYPNFAGYYNFFNWGASGESVDAVIINGLTRARDEGWNSRATSIIEGAKQLSNSYISQNQDTYYYMAFNLLNGVYSHQYASSIYDSYNKSKNIAKTYSSNLSAVLEFRIPVFDGMSNTPAPSVDKSNKYNNYYLTGMSAEGIAIPFDMYNQNYNLKISGSTTLNLTTFTSAAISAPQQVNLVPGTTPVTVTVKSETGFTNTYTLNFEASAPCTLTIQASSVTELPAFTPSSTVIKGDFNGDGKVSVSEVAKVQKHFIGLTSLSDAQFSIGDTNDDGKITVADVARVQKNFLGMN